MAPRPLVAGNWKMNGLRESIAELHSLIPELGETFADVLVCPPATLIVPFAECARGSAVSIGAQDCHAAPFGAHTGDLSAEMLGDAGAASVIVGHSERRADHGESDATVRAKAEAALRAKLVPIVCIGESEEERDAGRTLEVVLGQLAGSLPREVPSQRLVVAYEPVWAIGTGRTPSDDDIAEVHAALREALSERLGREEARSIRLLYGGSVKPSNAEAIFAIPEVDGGLVGGASLRAADFLAVIAAAG